MKNYTIKIIWSFILLLALNYPASAQDSETRDTFQLPKEKIFLHLNNSLFLTGDNLLYSIYCMDQQQHKLSHISKMAYVELIGKDTVPVFKQKVRLLDGKGHGEFFIPSSVSSGNYKLIAYTRWMTNGLVKDMFQQDMVIINPFHKDQSALLSSPSDSTEISGFGTVAMEVKEQTGNFDILVKKGQVNCREKVEFSIQTSEKYFGNYSISVRKITEIPAPGLQNSLTYFAKGKDTGLYRVNQKEGGLVLPELRGEMIQGSVRRAEDDRPASKIKVALSIPEKSFVFKVVETDINGTFFFIVDKAYRGNKAVIQVLEEDGKKYEIKMMEHRSPDYSQLDFANYTISRAHADAILDNSIDIQIQNSYAEIHLDSLVPIENREPVYENDLYEYLLDDYTRFPTVKETILEVVAMAYTRQKNNKGSIHTKVYNEYLEKDLNTLLIVDGLYIKDHDAVIHARSSKIKKISVYNKSYIYGPEVFEGIVSMESFHGDFLNDLPQYTSSTFDLFTPLKERTFYQQDYHSGKDFDRVPDQRWQLYWNPKLRLSETERQFSFYTSDVKGKYEIVLEGLSDSGLPLSRIKTFEVK